MGIQYNKIERLLILGKQIADLKEEEKLLLCPQCTDIDDIRKLHKHFNCLILELPVNLRPKLGDQRRIFLFIILYLYSPGALAGRYMDRGVRKMLKEVLNLNSVAAVNYYVEELKVFYECYPDFRELTNRIFSQLIHKD